MSKGSSRRPTQVPAKRVEENWDKIFNKTEEIDVPTAEQIIEDIKARQKEKDQKKTFNNRRVYKKKTDRKGKRIFGNINCNLY